MRRKQAIKKETTPDPKYNNVLASKFVNHLMEEGKKSIAESIFYKALESAAKSLKKEDPIEVLEQAIRNTSPMLEVKSRRVGGANYQVPYEVRGKRKEFLAMNWIINAAKNKKGKAMANKLAEELINAFNNTGDAVKKKDETHRVAEANRAFAHFAW